MESLERLREEFEGLREWVYLNTAAMGVVPRSVAAAANSYYDEAAQRNGDVNQIWRNRTEQTRKSVAALLNVAPEEIAFVPSTSFGMNLVAMMLKRTGKSEIVAAETEFPTTTLPFLHHGFVVRWVKAEDGALSVESFAEQITPRTAAVVAAVTQFSSGWRLDPVQLGRLAKDKSVLLVLNLTQTVGSFPVDLYAAGADFAAFTGVKWLCAGEGSGVLFVRRAFLEWTKPPIFGWNSTPDPYRMDNRWLEVRRDAARFEVGNIAFAPVFALNAAVKLYNRVGPQNVAQRTLNLAAMLAEGLQKAGFSLFTNWEDAAHRSGIVTFRVREAEKVVEALRQKRIAVSARWGMVRASVHWYNTEEEVERFVATLKELGAQPE